MRFLPTAAPLEYQLHPNTSQIHPYMYGCIWESDTLRAGSAGPGRSEDAMSGKSGKGAARAVPRAHGRRSAISCNYG